MTDYNVFRRLTRGVEECEQAGFEFRSFEGVNVSLRYDCDGVTEGLVTIGLFPSMEEAVEFARGAVWMRNIMAAAEVQEKEARDD
jgi:hypothetical protein